MRVIISAAISLDGYLDDSSDKRLNLSSAEDWLGVRELRTWCDAILVGANTVRSDNPSLMVREESQRTERVKRGFEPDITKVTVTASGNLSPEFDFFREGSGRKIVIAQKGADQELLNALKPYAEVVELEQISAKAIARRLSEMGVESLMVEGGSKILTMFLEEGVVDEMRLAVAPIFVGDSSAPRFVGDGDFPWNRERRMNLVEVEKLGDTVVLHFEIERDEESK